VEKIVIIIKTKEAVARQLGIDAYATGAMASGHASVIQGLGKNLACVRQHWQAAWARRVMHEPDRKVLEALLGGFFLVASSRSTAGRRGVS